MLLCLVFSSAAFAGNKENARDLLTRSFQQANPWTQGPAKLEAKVSLPKPDGSTIDFTYTLSWASPEKWRAEWTSNGFDQVTVLNGNKLSYFSTQPHQLVQPLQFEAAVAALTGGNPAGPYTIPPVSVAKAKIDDNKKKVNGVDTRCLAFGDPTESFCIDPTTARLLSMTTSLSGGVEVGSFEYSDYTTLGNLTYPQTIKVIYAKTPLETGKLTITRGDKFDEKLFAAPDKSTSVDWPSCADVDKNFTAPELKKSVQAKMPEADRKAKKYGLVWAMATVAKDGSVSKAEVIGGDPDFTTAATDAVKQYKFTPYMRCGQAVEFQKTIVVPFAPPQKLQDDIVPDSRL